MLSGQYQFGGRFGKDLHGMVRFYMLQEDGRKHLRIENRGRFSFVGFSDIGETLLNPRKLSEELRGQIGLVFLKIRVLIPEVPIQPRKDVLAVIDRLERVADLLVQEHDSNEMALIWDTIETEIRALRGNSAYTTSPISISMNRLLDEGLNQLQSFISGQIRLAPPTGILTQDGIRLDNMLNFPARLRLGIGYLYNMDLCGSHRLPLNAARDQVLNNEQSEMVIRYLHKTLGHFLGQWFSEEGIDRNERSLHCKQLPSLLVESIYAAYAGAGNGK